MDNNKTILFFDGVCGLCNRFVDFVIKRDKEHQIHFAPLQGQTSQNVLDANYSEELKTLIFYKDSNVLLRSDAVLEILKILGGFWGIFSIFKIIPRPIRDAVYNFIAHNRYKWFGKRDLCRVPTPEERDYFLD